MTKEALKSAIEFAEYCLEELDLSHMASNQAKRLVQKSKEALAKPEQERCVGCEACIDTACGRDECPKGWPKAAQPEQEPVAMKFKIYKPTVPDPMRQDINDALLPWVYDQSRGSGFVASMWVTPVATLPPQRTWVGLDPEEIRKTNHHMVDGAYHYSFKQGAEWAESKLKEENT